MGYQQWSVREWELGKSADRRSFSFCRSSLPSFFCTHWARARGTISVMKKPTSWQRRNAAKLGLAPAEVQNRCKKKKSFRT